MEGLHQFAETMRFIHTIQSVILLIITIIFIIFIYRSYKNGKKIKLLIILFLFYLCHLVNFFFSEQVHYITQNVKAKYYLLIKDYNK